jgi:hypothetical protein
MQRNPQVDFLAQGPKADTDIPFTFGPKNLELPRGIYHNESSN